MSSQATVIGCKVGLLLPSREAALWAGGDTAVLLDAARQAEEAGYDSVWTGESLLARPRCDPLVLLAAVAAATRRAELGTAVLLPLLRHPLPLAHALGSLDRLAGGRLLVGIGPGAEVSGTHRELAAVGATGDRRVARMLDTMDRCQRLWRDEEPGVRLRPRPTRPSGPPLWLAAHGPRLLRLAGGRFDGWLPFCPTAQQYGAGLRAVREAAEEAGRHPDTIVTAAYLTVALATNRRRAMEELDRYMLAYYGEPADVMGQMQACHAGTVASAVEWLASYAEVGARHLVIRLARPGLGGYQDAAGELLAALRTA